MEEDITIFLYNLIHGVGPRDGGLQLVYAPQTNLKLHASRVYAHRFFYSTECYGTDLSDTYFRDLLAKYKIVKTEITEDFKIQKLESRIVILQALLKYVWGLYDKLRKKDIVTADRKRLASIQDGDSRDDNFDIAENIIN